MFKTISTNSLYIERSKPTNNCDFSTYHGFTRCFEIDSVKANSMERRLNNIFSNVEKTYSGGFVSFEFWTVEKDNAAELNPLLKKLF